MEHKNDVPLWPQTRFQSLAFSRIIAVNFIGIKFKTIEAKSEVQTHRHNVTKIQKYYEIIFNNLTVYDSIIADI